ncbi:hypothetical protein SAMN03080615_02864 [Amphritea atlantica]|uniref:Uncharacterized protein n=1 Tax=Amphritea atlantica TaxID=355243 RepID=A0A1H9J4E9_9GAMM|nr:hypothetical protein [Amphritea atlantica]SEQ81619.1 hypothetical protein SAMN03080615_02864 [Amphritea atlantica]
MKQRYAFPKMNVVQCALNIKQMAADSWWVYRHEMCGNGTLKPVSRVVFFGRTRADVDRWIETQRQESTVYMLSDN